MSGTICRLSIYGGYTTFGETYPPSIGEKEFTIVEEGQYIITFDDGSYIYKKRLYKVEHNTVYFYKGDRAKALQLLADENEKRKQMMIEEVNVIDNIIPFINLELEKEGNAND